MIEVTDVQIKLPSNRDVNDKFKCFVNIVFNNKFIVRNLRIIEGSKGFFVVMPNYKKRDGSFQDIAHPLDNEFRKQIEDKVFEAYETALKKAKEEQSTS